MSYDKISVLSWQSYHGRTPGSIGSSLIRADWLCAADERFVPWKHGDTFDALILQKVYWKNLAQDFPGPTILDVCDPDWMSGEFQIVDLSQHLKAITTSSEALKKALDGHVKCPVVHVPDRVNFNAIPAPKPYSPDRPKTVVWYGYIHNWSQVLTDILQTIKMLNLRLLVVSNNQYQPLNDYGVDIENVKWEPGQAWREIQRGDLVLNPPFPFGKFQYKSNNKTVISAALGLPVATNFDELKALLDADQRKEWLDKSKEWLKDYDIKLSSQQYLDILNG